MLGIILICAGSVWILVVWIR